MKTSSSVAFRDLQFRQLDAAFARAAASAPRASRLTVAVRNLIAGVLAHQIVDARHRRRARPDPAGDAVVSDTDCMAVDSAIRLARRAGGDDAAAIDDRDPIAELLGLVDVVRGQQHRVAVAFHLRDFGVQFAARLRIEPGRRLVQKDELRVVDERQRDGEPLSLPSRQRVEAGVRLLGRARTAAAVGRGVPCPDRTSAKSVKASRGVILSCSAIV